MTVFVWLAEYHRQRGATIDSVNRELLSIRQNDGPMSQGEYIKISAKDRAVIGEYAAKNGISAAIHYFKRNGRFPNLKETSVRGWKIISYLL